MNETFHEDSMKHAPRVEALIGDMMSQIKDIPGPIVAYLALLESAGAMNHFVGPLQVAELLDAMATQYRSVVH